MNLLVIKFLISWTQASILLAYFLFHKVSFKALFLYLSFRILILNQTLFKSGYISPIGGMFSES